jgi:hypothetical protein
MRRRAPSEIASAGETRGSLPAAAGRCEVTVGQSHLLGFHEMIELSRGHLDHCPAVDVGALAEERPALSDRARGDLVDAPPRALIYRPRRRASERLAYPEACVRHPRNSGERRPDAIAA